MNKPARHDTSAIVDPLTINALHHFNNFSEHRRTLVRQSEWTHCFAVPGFLPVLLPSHQTLANARNRAKAPTLIGVGLGLLIVAAWWPIAPIVTAMAIIAFGATDAMVSRFGGSTSAWPLMALHGTMYVTLYALFVGARLHVSATALTPGVGGLTMIDLVVSAFPMSIALKRIWSSLSQSTVSRN
jgi:hypothetical protein